MVGVGVVVGVTGILVGVGAIVDTIVGTIVGDDAKTVGVMLFWASRVGAADGATDACCVGNTTLLGATVTVTLPLAT